MSLKQYGVLKGSVVETQGGDGERPHYNIHVKALDKHYRVAINIQSQGDKYPAELLYYMDQHFQHPITKKLTTLSHGYHELVREPHGFALDYLRGKLFQIRDLRAIPATKPGDHNDLNDLMTHYMERAAKEKNIDFYVFGEPFDHEKGRDDYFGFRPKRGMHNIHMNQGNRGRDGWVKDDGVWQDGALFLHLTDDDQWIAFFLAFQSQCFETDDKTGHCLS